jgi:hypothetical protein
VGAKEGTKLEAVAKAYQDLTKRQVCFLYQVPKDFLGSKQNYSRRNVVKPPCSDSRGNVQTDKSQSRYNVRLYLKIRENHNHASPFFPQKNARVALVHDIELKKGSPKQFAPRTKPEPSPKSGAGKFCSKKGVSISSSLLSSLALRVPQVNVLNMSQIRSHLFFVNIDCARRRRKPRTDGVIPLIRRSDSKRVAA